MKTFYLHSKNSLEYSVYDTNIALAIYRAEILISLVVMLVRVSLCQILCICAGFVGTYYSPASIPSISVYVCGGGVTLCEN